MTKLSFITILGLTASGLIALSSGAQAEVIDLTGTNNSGRINRAEFDWTPEQPTGTGLIQPFLRVQANPAEQGYNTSGGTVFDDKGGPWTHDLQVSDLKLVQIGRISYYEFLLDINEPGGSKSLVTLDRLEFYTSDIPSQTTTDVSSLGILRWSLDFREDSYILLDASRNHGSGSGDMYPYIPASNFAGALPTDYVYMYCRFGDQTGATSEGGFEEWAIDHND